MSKFPQPGTPSASARPDEADVLFSIQKLKSINLQVFVMLAAIAVIIVFLA